MSTPAPPITAEDLMKQVVGLQKAANSGNTDAQDELKRRAAARATPSKTNNPATPAVTPLKPLVEPLKDRYVVRPNGDRYYLRNIGVHQDVPTLRLARDKEMPILLYGQPGCGKTALFEAAFFDADVARDPQGLGFRYVPGSGDTEVSDFIGAYVPKPGGDFEWIDGPLVDAMAHGLPLLVDEVALIDPKVMAVVYSAMDGRKEINVTANPGRDGGAIVQAKKGFAIFGACNPNAPGARMSEALLSRFALHVSVEVDFKLMKELGVPAKFITVCTNLEKKMKVGEISWFPAIREMLQFKQVAAVFGDATALSNIVAMAPELDREIVQNAVDRAYGDSFPALAIK